MDIQSQKVLDGVSVLFLGILYAPLSAWTGHGQMLLPRTSAGAADTASMLGPSLYCSCCEGGVDLVIFFSLLI